MKRLEYLNMEGNPINLNWWQLKKEVEDCTKLKVLNNIKLTSCKQFYNNWNNYGNDEYFKEICGFNYGDI